MVAPRHQIQAILCAAVPEEGASKPRRGSELHQKRNNNLGLKVSSSPAVQHGETEAVDTAQDGMSQRRKELRQKSLTRSSR